MHPGLAGLAPTVAPQSLSTAQLIYAALGIISPLLFALLWTPLAPALSLPHARP
ncbi:MAG TPA: hypothetical protein VF120_18100 [Ktedonobacterales bacterium]